jgi:hypothetical protein
MFAASNEDITELGSGLILSAKSSSVLNGNEHRSSEHLQAEERRQRRIRWRWRVRKTSSPQPSTSANIIQTSPEENQQG